jgi:hypothetical protein
MQNTKMLSVHDLLRSVSRLLGRKHSRRSLHFPEGVCTEIADDSDWHRTRRGYMRYRSAKILKLGGRRWVLARGDKSGSYPADAYDSDIIAIPIADQGKVDAKLAEQVAQSIREGSYFRHTLVCGLADGRLACYTRSPFADQMAASLRFMLVRIIAEDVRRDERYLSLSDLRPIVTSSMKYRPEAVHILADAIREILSSQK